MTIIDGDRDHCCIWWKWSAQKVDLCLLIRHSLLCHNIQYTPISFFTFATTQSIRQPLLFIAIIASAIPLVNTTYRCQSTLTTCSRFCLQCSPVSVYSCPVFVYRIRNNGTVEQYAIWSIIKLKRLLLPSWRSSDGMVPSCYCWSEHFSALTASISTVFLAVLPSRSPREGFISWWCVSTKNHHP